jgi:O-antigen/teichoic acid export membrane protein
MLAVAGQSVAYFLAITLARQLGVDGFEAYAVASAAFTLMVVFAPRGIEKYALRSLPAFLERGDWGRAGGFLRFGLRRTLGTSLVVGSVVCLLVLIFSDYPSATKLAICVSCLSLPTGALVHYYVEVLSANGRDILATAVFRLAVPIMTLVVVGLLIYAPIEVSGAMAVGSWGIAWTLALSVMVIQVRRTTPSQVWTARRTEEKTTWSREAKPFLFYRVALALLAQIAVIALDRLHPSAAAVGAYVAAMSTANMALVLTTSTNRFYSRQLSIMLEQQDYAGILELRRERLRWLLPSMIIFVAIVFFFGRDILGFFRPEFVNEGLTALRLLAVATAFCVLFSLAPTYLKYKGHNRSLRRIVAGAVLVQVILLVLLVPKYAATGAAVAFAVSMCGMYVVAGRMARRELAMLRSHAKP